MEYENGTSPAEEIAQAAAKLRELLHCGNERVELAAAKEILAMPEGAEKQQEKTVCLEVEIRVLET